MFSNLSQLFKKVWVRVTAFVAAVSGLFGIVDHVLKWGVFEKLKYVWQSILIPFFTQRVSLPLFFLVVMGTGCLFFLCGIIFKFYKRKEFYIPIKTEFYTEHPPNELSRKTKWNFKGYKNYYYIPLLVRSYGDSVDFRDFTGPYCFRCDHILHLEGIQGSDMGHSFKCINCNRKFGVPRELRRNYQDKLSAYFQEEFRQNRLREAR